MKYLYLLILPILIWNCSTTQPIVTEAVTIPDETIAEEVLKKPDLIKPKAGLSQERLEWITDMCESAIEDEQIPGVVALISRNGEIAYHEAFGTADANGRALDKNDIFRIASQTKAITSTAVLMLWEKGLFRLDDPISKYIPEFKNPTVLDSFIEQDSSFITKPAGKEITIRHLLTHTSGLGYGVIDGDPRFKKMYAKAGVTDLYSTKDISIEESVKKLATLPLHHTPGEKFTYSEGLDVLGYFIEIISTKPFDKFLREELFDPLGMDDTWFYLPESKADRLVKIQHMVDGNWENYPVTFYDPAYPIKGAKRFFSGGAGLSSTALDYAKFLQMYLNKGTLNGKRILSKNTVNTILTDQLGELSKNEPWGFSLAFGLVKDLGVAEGGKGSEGTFDWGGYFNTQYFADPQEQLIGIIMKQTQKTATDETGWKFRQMAFSTIND